MKTGRVEVTVLFIICLYLLNPCDISAYTYLVEEVGVFCVLNEKMNLISGLWNIIPGKNSENASTNATNTILSIAPQGFDLVGANKGFSLCLHLRRTLPFRQDIRILAQQCSSFRAKSGNPYPSEEKDGLKRARPHLMLIMMYCFFTPRDVVVACIYCDCITGAHAWAWIIFINWTTFRTNINNHFVSFSW